MELQAVIDASRLWGVDHWVRQNLSAWAHSSGADDLLHHTNSSEALGFQLTGSLIMPFPSTPDGSFSTANEAVAHAAAANAKMRPIYAVHPGRGAEAVDELMKLDLISPCVGVKLWPYLGRFNLDDILDNFELVRYLSTGQKCIFMHVGNGREQETRPVFPDVRATPDIAVKCARELSDIRIIVAHAARLCPKTLTAIAALPNTYLDFSGITSLGRWREGGLDGLAVSAGLSLAALGPSEVLRRLVYDYSLERKLLFGTTWPFSLWWGVDVLDDIAFLRDAPISHGAKENIFFNNIRMPALSGGVFSGS